MKYFFYILVARTKRTVRRGKLGAAAASSAPPPPPPPRPPQLPIPKSSNSKKLTAARKQIKETSIKSTGGKQPKPLPGILNPANNSTSYSSSSGESVPETESHTNANIPVSIGASSHGGKTRQLASENSAPRTAIQGLPQRPGPSRNAAVTTYRGSGRAHPRKYKRTSTKRAEDYCPVKKVRYFTLY